VYRAKRLGVRILPGGDCGCAWNPVGRNTRDLEHFVTLLGFTPMEAIRLGNPPQDVKLLQDADRFLAIMKDGAFHKAPTTDRRARPRSAARRRW
jgi:hypothetical protein